MTPKCSSVKGKMRDCRLSDAKGLENIHQNVLNEFVGVYVHWDKAKKKKGLSQTVPTKLEAYNCPKSLGLLKDSNFPSLELRGQPLKKQLHSIIPPPPNCTVGTMQSGRYHSPGIRQTQTLTSDGQIEKRESALHRRRFHLIVPTCSNGCG